MDFKDRIEKIKSILPLKFFYEESFDTNLRTKISSDLVLEGIDKNASILKCGILLTREQELHLFRKYNYLKYRITKQTANVKLEKLKNTGLAEIEKNIKKMQDTRNIIIKCNVRIVVKPAYRYLGSDSLKKEEFFSNGYVHMMKAIECFDHRMGFKFSTYFTRVLCTNFKKDRIKIAKYSHENLKNEGEILDKREIDHRETNESYNKQFVNKILSAVYKLRRNSRKDYKIRVNVVKKYFGIDDGKQKTLREVGEQFGFSKERTRMLVDDTIDTIKELNFCYDPLN